VTRHGGGTFTGRWKQTTTCLLHTSDGWVLVRQQVIRWLCRHGKAVCRLCAGDSLDAALLMSNFTVEFDLHTPVHRTSGPRWKKARPDQHDAFDVSSEWLPPAGHAAGYVLGASRPTHDEAFCVRCFNTPRLDKRVFVMTAVATTVACFFNRPRPLLYPSQTAASRCDTIGTSSPALRLRPVLLCSLRTYDLPVL
jgi:hypothetical protein